MKGKRKNEGLRGNERVTFRVIGQLKLNWAPQGDQCR